MCFRLHFTCFFNPLMCMCALGLHLLRGLYRQVGLQPRWSQRPRARAPHLRPPGHEPRTHQEVRVLCHGQIPQSREDDISHHWVSGIRCQEIIVAHNMVVITSGSDQTYYLHTQGHSPHQQLPRGHLEDHAG